MDAERGLRLLCILAHPDDESLATGGTLAKYAAEGVETYLITATRGERGWAGDPAEDPGPESLGQVRTVELQAAAAVLKLREATILGYPDEGLHRIDPAEVVDRLVEHLRRIRPQVVLTFGPDGATGHPDHIAISQLTTAAVLHAANPDARNGCSARAHQVAKLYYRIETCADIAAFEAVFGRLSLTIDGVERRWGGWPDWALTTRLDTTPYWEQVWQAIACHRSQLPGLAALNALPPDQHQRLWGPQGFYRTFSLVNGGGEVETDLFDGL